MKLTVFCIPMIAITIWSCEGNLEPTTSTLTQSGDNAGLETYLVGITTKIKDSTSTKDLKLLIKRGNSLNTPSCVGVRGFGSNPLYVKLKFHGRGDWKLDANDTLRNYYHIYTNDDTNTLNEGEIDLTMHWIIQRTDKNTGKIASTELTGGNQNKPMTGPENSRLGYFSAKWENKLYEYQNDVENKTNLAIGKMADTTPSRNEFDSSCDS